MKCTMPSQGLRSSMSDPARRSGFSIPEVLAVVAVIAIIMSMLLPNYGKAREVARESACRQNLRTIAICSRNYSTETRYLPNGWNTADGSIVWIRELWNYMDHDPVWFNCPSAPRQAHWAGIKKGSGVPAGGSYLADEFRVSMHENFSYGHNNDGSQAGLNVGVGETTHHPPGGQPNPNSVYIRIGNVVAPSDFIMYADSTVDGLWDHFIDEDYEDGAGRTEYPADRHDGGCFIAFGDGHVNYELQKYLIHLGPVGTALPEQRKRWNNDNKPH